jgi:rubrerythrin
MQYRELWVTVLAALIMSGGAASTLADAQGPYVRTIESLKKRYAEEVQAHRKYSVYTHKAIDDDYPHIAHLFKSLTQSEAIHARNFERLLLELGVTPEELPNTSQIDFEVGSTKENLKHATAVETEEIDREYPAVLEYIKAEGHQQAITRITWAWKAEEQHRSLMGRIHAAASTWFGMLAAHIEAKSKRYYVCQVCGSMLTTLPAEQCPICGHPRTEYKEVEGYPGRAEGPEHE